MDLKEIYKQYNINTPEFSLKGIHCYARVVSIYDGDTITVVLPIFNSQYYKFNIRLLDIDTCEIRDKNMIKREQAIRARNRIFTIITGKSIDVNISYTDIEKLLDDDIYLVWIMCNEMEKYGRVLAHIKINESDDKTLSDILLIEDLAKPYDGSKKTT